MGQKVNPHGIRVGVIKDWGSRWYAEADFADYLVEDYNIRKFLKKKLYSAGVSDIEIERASDKVKIIIHTAKPGVVIGKGGAEIEKLKVEVSKYTTKKVFIDIKEIKRPDRDAQLVAESIAQQLMLLIVSHPGEVLGREDFGSVIWELEFHQLVKIKDWEEEVHNSLLDSILRYEPRLREVVLEVRLAEIDDDTDEDIKSKHPYVRRRASIRVQGVIDNTDEPFSFQTQVYISPLSQ